MITVDIIIVIAVVTATGQMLCLHALVIHQIRAVRTRSGRVRGQGLRRRTTASDRVFIVIISRSIHSICYIGRL